MTVSATPPGALGTPVAPPCTLVIFGAAGDLTKRLLIPAIYNLTGDRLLNDGLRFIGLDHNQHDDGHWRDELHEAIEGFTKDPGAEFQAKTIDPARWAWIAERLTYRVFDFERPGDYAALDGDLAKQPNGAGNAIFYLAVAARFFGTIAGNLGAAGLLKESAGAFRRIVVEKPFGSDLSSARELNRQLLSVAAESQIYRIDHFLGKDPVRAIAALRFDNGVFEPLLRREHVDHVQITAAETLGVEERGKFYEATGALRDMIPNHLFSLLTMIAMDAPVSLDPDDVRTEKAKLVRAIAPIRPADAVRGQYAAGTENDRPVRGYRDEDDVAGDSRTETYAALGVHVDNWRWEGVPFYLRTGKRLARHRTTIAVHFRPAPRRLFPRASDPAAHNVMTLGIDPDRGITITFTTKVPGPLLELAGVAARFAYADAFAAKPSVGYESLIYDCMNGNATNFQRADMIEASWAAVQPVLDAWAHAPDAPHAYAAGGEGPLAADELLRRGGHTWLPLA